MGEESKYDLCGGNWQTLNSVLTRCVCAGWNDARNGRAKRRTGPELARLFCSAWRKGHTRLLADAYRAGRWQWETSTAGAQGSLHRESTNGA
jgi:hypothetical protein